MLRGGVGREGGRGGRGGEGREGGREGGKSGTPLPLSVRKTTHDFLQT